MATTQEYQGMFAVGMRLKSKVTKRGHVITKAEGRDRFFLDGGVNCAWSAHGLRRDMDPVRPADSDTAAWSLFLPDAPLPDTGPNVFKVGDVVAATYCAERFVLRINGPKTMTAYPATVLASSDGVHGHDDRFGCEHAVLLFDVPADKAGACSVCMYEPCTRERHDAAVAGLTTTASTQSILPTRSGPHVKPEVGMRIKLARHSHGAAMSEPGVQREVDADDLRPGNAYFEGNWRDGCYDLLPTPAPQPRPAPDVWRVGQRRKGRIEDMYSVDRPLVEFEVVSKYAGNDGGYDWKGKVTAGWNVGRTYGFRESWPSTLLADAPSQPQQPAPVSGCREPGWCGLPWGDDRVPMARHYPARVATLPLGVTSPCYCSAACKSAKEAKPAAAPAHVCKGRPCGKDAQEAGEAPDTFAVYRIYGEKQSHIGRRWFCSLKCADAWKPQPAHEALKPAWKCRGPVEPPGPCTTPDAPAHSGGPYCIACVDKGIARRMQNRAEVVPWLKRRYALESLAQHHLPGSTPVTRPSDIVSGETPYGVADSIWEGPS